MAPKRSADQVKMKYKNIQIGIFPPSYWYILSVQHLNCHTIFVTHKADSRQTGSGPLIVLTPVKELAIDIHSGRPGMEGVPGGTSSESQGPCEGTWLNVGFTVFLVF